MMLPEWRLRKVGYAIKRRMIPGSFKTFQVATGEYKWEYKVPCDCGAVGCGPDTAFSCASFSKDEIAVISRVVEGGQ
jgi:hypothetical protein